MLELIRREFTVDAPLARAWQHLAQVEQWPTWAKHIHRVELTPKGELTHDTKGSFHLRNGLRSTFQMTEFNPMRNWQWVGPFLWLTVYYDHQFEPVNEQRTKLIWVIGAEGFGVALFGRLFAAIYNQNLNQAIPRLVAEMRGQIKVDQNP
ncbi:MAG: SRPBCC family protein [Caldilineaceae bacterium]